MKRFIFLRISLNILTIYLFFHIWIFNGFSYKIFIPFALLLSLKFVAKKILIYKRNRALIGSEKLKSLNKYINFLNHYYK